MPVGVSVAEVRWDEPALREMLGDASGPVGVLMERMCLAVQNRASELCPVDTGRLRSSITHMVVVEGGDVVGYVGTDVEYAAPVEFGTYRSAAQPFLRPALDAAREVVGGGGGGDNDIVSYTRRDGTTRSATRAQARHWSGGSQG